MRIFKRANTLLAALLIVAASAIATFSSCTTTAEYTLGEEFIPGNQQMKIRHRVYKGGMLKETDGPALHSHRVHCMRSDLQCPSSC